MAYRVEIARNAEAELEELYLWVVARAPEQGAKWFNGLERAVLSLDQHPKRCPVAPESLAPKQPVRVLHYGRKPHVYRIFAVEANLNQSGGTTCRRLARAASEAPSVQMFTRKASIGLLQCRRSRASPRECWPPPASEAGVIYRFDQFTVNEETRQLLSREGERHLSPKAFDLLALLIANCPRALSKTVLQDRLWPATFVQETNLAGLVAEIRRALDDSAANPRFVRTVHRFGYRFVAEMSTEVETPRLAARSPRPVLKFEQRHLLLMEGPNLIGRSPQATIHIDSPGLSRLHARVVVSGSDATVEDLGSKNGTHVNGTRIESPTRLSDGDEIRLGAIVVTFRVDAPRGTTETFASPATHFAGKPG